MVCDYSDVPPPRVYAEESDDADYEECEIPGMLDQIDVPQGEVAQNLESSLPVRDAHLDQRDGIVCEVRGI